MTDSQVAWNDSRKACKTSRGSKFLSNYNIDIKLFKNSALQECPHRKTKKAFIGTFSRKHLSGKAGILLSLLRNAEMGAQKQLLVLFNSYNGEVFLESLAF